MKRAEPIDAASGSRARRFRLAAEILPVALILASIGGTTGLVLRVHSRAIPPKKVPTPPVVVPVREVEPVPTAPPPPAPVLAVELPEDPTPKELARLAALRDGEVAEAGRLAREAEAIERARGRTTGEAEKLARAERDIRRRASMLDGNLAKLETELDNLAFHREALTRERDEAKAALGREKLRSSSGYSVQPYKGPNGTWRRPIAIECVNGTIKIQPDGPEFGLLDLSPLQGLRSSPLVSAVARETTRIQGPTPDGSPSVPYILFVIRPDGIRPYYEALMRLEPLGLAFGYELVDQDWIIDYPPPGDFPGLDRSTPALPRWPADRPLAGGRGSGAGGEGGEGPGGSRSGGSGFGASGFGGSGLAGMSPGGSGPSGSGLAGSGLGASDSAGRPHLFAGESAGGLAFEPTPPLDPTAPEQDQGGGTGKGLEQGSDLSLVPFAPGGTRPQTRNGRGGGEFSGAERAASGGGFGPEDGDRLPPGLASGSEPGRMATEGPGGILEKSSPGGGNPAGGPPSSLGGRVFADGVTSTTGRTSAPGDGRSPLGGMPVPGSNLNPGANSGRNAPGTQPGGIAANGEKPGVAGSSGGAGSATGTGTGLGSGSGPDSGKGTGLEATNHRPEKDLELVVSCGPKGVVIHPGAYRLSKASLRAKDAKLARSLKTIVTARQISQPEMIWKPQVRFQVEPGGQKTYWTARGQVLMEGLDWPTTVRLADAVPRTFGQELR